MLDRLHTRVYGHGLHMHFKDFIVLLDGTCAQCRLSIWDDHGPGSSPLDRWGVYSLSGWVAVMYGIGI